MIFVFLKFCCISVFFPGKFNSFTDHLYCIGVLTAKNHATDELVGMIEPSVK